MEVVGAGYLSQCPVLCKELRDGVDIHGNNQTALGFKDLKDGRLIAKIFLFRLIYGGNKFSYAHDPMFNKISNKPDYWENVINEFYNKYYGLANWHAKLFNGVCRTGYWVSPTGRRYDFSPTKSKIGVIEWPRTTILNYPVNFSGFNGKPLSKKWVNSGEDLIG